MVYDGIFDSIIFLFVIIKLYNGWINPNVIFSIVSVSAST